GPRWGVGGAAARPATAPIPCCQLRPVPEIATFFVRSSSLPRRSADRSRPSSLTANGTQPNAGHDRRWEDSGNRDIGSTNPEDPHFRAIKESYNGQPNAQGSGAIGVSARRTHDELEDLGLVAQPVVAS